jgi:hypothetical protein
MGVFGRVLKDERYSPFGGCTSERTAAVAEPSCSACGLAWRRGFLVRMRLPQPRAAAGLRHSRGPFPDRAGRRSSVFRCSLNSGCPRLPSLGRFGEGEKRGTKHIDPERLLAFGFADSSVAQADALIGNEPSYGRTRFSRWSDAFFTSQSNETPKPRPGSREQLLPGQPEVRLESSSGAGTVR